MVVLQATPPNQAAQALESFITLVQEPDNLEAIYDIAEMLNHTDLGYLAREYLTAQPGVAEIIRERYLTGTPDLDALLNCPPGSLGHEFATHMKTAGLNPDFYRTVIVKDNASYIALRLRQTHDIHHIVTGFGTDIPDEIGLQAFQLAQTRSPLGIALIASSFANNISSTPVLTQIIDCIHHGWHMGINAKPFLAQKWEQNWDKPLTEWRRELGIGNWE
jgi:ubiquinone biosynthesis protein Coq4